MGWIHKRHMKNGGSIGPGGLSDSKRGAPLRRVVGTTIDRRSLFSANTVSLECGHEAESWGGTRARCVVCKHVAEACVALGTAIARWLST